jgi:hypothetical protein
MPYRTKLSLVVQSAIDGIFWETGCTYASMRPEGPAPTTRTSLKNASYPFELLVTMLAAVELPVSLLCEVEGTESVARPGAILTTLGYSGGLLLVLEAGDRFMKDHIDGDML